MIDKITESELQDLLDVFDKGTTAQIVRMFDDIAGIEVRPYTGYQFYSGGDFLGDIHWNDIPEILEAAWIKVVEDEN